MLSESYVGLCVAIGSVLQRIGPRRSNVERGHIYFVVVRVAGGGSETEVTRGRGRPWGRLLILLVHPDVKVHVQMFIDENHNKH